MTGSQAYRAIVNQRHGRFRVYMGDGRVLCFSPEAPQPITVNFVDGKRWNDVDVFMWCSGLAAGWEYL